jgi:hypothetical protein
LNADRANPSSFAESAKSAFKKNIHDSDLIIEKGGPRFIWSRPFYLLFTFYFVLLLSVDQTTRTISEKNVDLLQIQHRRDFALAEMRVHHRLAFLIFPRPIVR